MKRIIPVLMIFLVLLFSCETIESEEALQETDVSGMNIASIEDDNQAVANDEVPKETLETESVEVFPEVIAVVSVPEESAVANEHAIDSVDIPVVQEPEEATSIEPIVEDIEAEDVETGYPKADDISATSEDLIVSIDENPVEAIEESPVEDINEAVLEKAVDNAESVIEEEPAVASQIDTVQQLPAVSPSNADEISVENTDIDPSPAVSTVQNQSFPKPVLDSSVSPTFLQILSVVIVLTVLFTISVAIRGANKMSLPKGLSLALSILFTALSIVVSTLVGGWSYIWLFYLLLLLSYFIFRAKWRNSVFG